MEPETGKFKLSLLPVHIAIVAMDPGDPAPVWLSACTFSSVTRTNDELSVVCDQAFVPGDLKAERDWRIIMVEGPLSFSMTGVLSTLLRPLAGAKIPVFVLSTYNTDYILIKNEKISMAVSILKNEGHNIT